MTEDYIVPPTQLLRDRPRVTGLIEGMLSLPISRNSQLNQGARVTSAGPVLEFYSLEKSKCSILGSGNIWMVLELSRHCQLAT
jgi:hypothetical protein